MVIVKTSVGSCGLEQYVGGQRSAMYTSMSWTSGKYVGQSLVVLGARGGGDFNY